MNFAASNAKNYYQPTQRLTGILKTKETFCSLTAYFIAGRLMMGMWQDNLKFVIGLEDNGLLIKPLIINRMHRITNEGHSIKLNDIEGKGSYFCGVELDDSKNGKSIDIFCDLLADIIIENLQIRYLINILRQRYFFLQEKTQCELLIKTLKQLWYGKTDIKSNITLCKLDVAERLHKCFLESDDKELVLEGFMRFRMKDYLEKWDALLKKNIDEYVMEKEYKEFIGVLRYFVLLREPKEVTIHLHYTALGGYELSDAQSNKISDDGIGAKEALRNKMTKEDVVLSALINISPEKIIIHNSKDISEKRLLMTIKNVFLDRVVFED